MNRGDKKAEETDETEGTEETDETEEDRQEHAVTHFAHVHARINTLTY